MSFKTWEEAVCWLMEKPEYRELVKSCYYDTPRQTAAERYLRSEEWHALKRYLPSGKGKVIDLGAGHGITSYALAKDGWQVTALEPDSSQLVGWKAIKLLAEENQLPISIMTENAENILSEDATYNLIFARQVLHHAHDLSKLFQESFRVLKPGGRMIAIREHVISSDRDLPKFLASHPLHHLYGGENALRLDQYLTAIETSGFIIEKTLRPFDSAINYAPFTQKSLYQEISNRLSKYPGGILLGNFLSVNLIFSIFLKVLSRLDRRPGRLFSFILKKPLL